MKESPVESPPGIEIEDLEVELAPTAGAQTKVQAYPATEYGFFAWLRSLFG
jgi:hypothetical protein